MSIMLFHAVITVCWQEILAKLTRKLGQNMFKKAIVLMIIHVQRCAAIQTRAHICGARAIIRIHNAW